MPMFGNPASIRALAGDFWNARARAGAVSGEVRGVVGRISGWEGPAASAGKAHTVKRAEHVERLFHGCEHVARTLEDLASGLDRANLVAGQAQALAAGNNLEINPASGAVTMRADGGPANTLLLQSVAGQIGEAQQLAQQAWTAAERALSSSEFPSLEEIAKEMGAVNAVSGLFSSGAEGRAATKFWSTVLGTDAKDARVVALLTRLEDGSIPAWKQAGIAGQILKMDLRSWGQGQEALKLLKDGGVTGSLSAAGRGLGVVAIIGDAMSIKNPDGTGAERSINRGMAAANAVGTAAGLLGANAADWVPVVGWGIAAATGVYLTGDYAYHHWTPFRHFVDRAVTTWRSPQPGVPGTVTPWAVWHPSG